MLATSAPAFGDLRCWSDGWRATGLRENEAYQQAADLDLIFNQSGLVCASR